MKQGWRKCGRDLISLDSPVVINFDHIVIKQAGRLTQNEKERTERMSIWPCGFTASDQIEQDQSISRG
jgi:hypothetical protein